MSCWPGQPCAHNSDPQPFRREQTNGSIDRSRAQLLELRAFSFRLEDFSLQARRTRGISAANLRERGALRLQKLRGAALDRLA